jgi:hypothetical protein
LKPGKYRLQATPRSARLTGKSRNVAFSVVR